MAVLGLPAIKPPQGMAAAMAVVAIIHGVYGACCQMPLTTLLGIRRNEADYLIYDTCENDV